MATVDLPLVQTGFIDSYGGSAGPIWNGVNGGNCTGTASFSSDGGANIGVQTVVSFTIDTSSLPNWPSGYAVSANTLEFVLTEGHSASMFIAFSCPSFISSNTSGAVSVPNGLSQTQFGFGNQNTAQLGTAHGTVASVVCHLVYTYTPPDQWYYNVLTNRYKYVASDPGAPWVLGDPTLTETAVTPIKGSTLGDD